MSEEYSKRAAGSSLAVFSSAGIYIVMSDVTQIRMSRVCARECELKVVVIEAMLCAWQMCSRGLKCKLINGDTDER